MQCLTCLRVCRALATSLIITVLQCGYVNGKPVATAGQVTATVTVWNAPGVKALANKQWNLNECSPGIQIRIGRKTLNRRSFYCTKSDAMTLAPLLVGETLQDRVYVWCQTALLYHTISPGVKIFDVEKLNLFDEDILLTRDSVDSVLAEFFPTPKLRSMSLSAARSYQNRTSRRFYRDTHLTRRQKRKALRDRSRLWVNRLIPFQILQGFSPYRRNTIIEAISLWEQNTCLRFVEQRPRGRSSHITFRDARQCSSTIGKMPRLQSISLGPSCDLVGIAAHEIGHALGFHHEHSRPDRERYISIVEKNVKKDQISQFARLQWATAATYGIPYDYSSVMHYASFTFTTNQKKTILTKDREMQKVIGQREQLSFYDVKLANVHYCADLCGGNSLEWPECKNGGYRNPNNCSSCICPHGLAPPRCEAPSLGENADCGRQILYASASEQYLSSPGYHADGFPSGGFCSWLIKTSSPGKQIKLEFTGNFNFEDDVDLCLDYVEVRYKGLALPGPRYCGTHRPDKVFLSYTKEILVNIQVFTEGNHGFQMKYTEESCGGCSSDAGADEPACHRMQKFICNPKRPEEGNCFRAESYCCNSHHQQNGRCLVEQDCSREHPSRLKNSFAMMEQPAPPKCAGNALLSPSSTTLTTVARTTRTTTATTRAATTATTAAATTTAATLKTTRRAPAFRPWLRRRPQTAKPARNTLRPFSNTTPQSSNQWGPWGRWSHCSSTCGSCGETYRRRSCMGTECIGQTYEVRRCGSTVCPFQTYQKSKLCRRRVRTGCQWWDLSCFENYTCYQLSTKPRCCVGTPVNGVCQR